MAGQIRITLVRSMIHNRQDQKDTVLMLGLRKMHHSVIREDTPSIRGMAFKVRHLVTVEPVEDAGA